MRSLLARLTRPVGNLEGLLLAIAVALPAAAFLLVPGFLVTSDGYYHLYRIVALDAELQAGQWPVRWVQSAYLGYGYPLFNYYAPLSYWLGELFHLAGLSFVNAFKAVALTGIMLGATGAYIVARRIVPPPAAVVASALYVYAPFPLTDLYFRADLPEYLALGLLPWAFWATLKGIERWRAVIPAGALLGVLILTHNGLAFVAAPFLGGFALWYALSPWAGPSTITTGVHPLFQNSLKPLPVLQPWAWALPRLTRVAALGLIALALSATFWLPALAERGLVQFDRLLLIDYREQFVGLADLLATDLVHRYVAVAVGTWHVFPYRFGLVQLLASVAGIGVLGYGLLLRRKRHAAEHLGLAFALVGMVALLLTQSITRPLWDHLPLLAHLQFPWRLLGMMALPAALLGALALAQAQPRPLRGALAIGVIAVTMWSSLAGLRPVYTDLGNQVATVGGSQWFEMLYNTIGTTTRGEFLPLAVEEPAATSASALAAVLGPEEAAWLPLPDVRVEPASAGTATASWDGRRLRAEISLSSPGVVKLPVAAFPAWQVAVNDSFLRWEPTAPDGLVGVQLAPGEHRLEAFYEETAIQRLSNVVSAITLVVVAPFCVLALWTSLRSWRQRRALRLDLTGLAVLRVAAVLGAALVITIALRQGVQRSAALPAGEVVGELAGGQVSFAARLEPAANGAVMRPVHAGDSLEVRLDFTGRGEVTPLVPEVMTARLTNAAGETWSILESTVDEGTSRVARLAVAPDAPPGIYRVEVWLYDQPGSSDPVEIGRFWRTSLLPVQNRIQLGPIVVLSGEAGPTSEAALVAYVGGLRLRAVSFATGYVDPRLPAAALPGQPLRVKAGEDAVVRTQWVAVEPISDDLRFSLHLIGKDGLLWAVRDTQPVAGLAPTSLWLPGRPMGEMTRLRVPADTPPGEYQLVLRVLRPTGEALSTLDAAGRPTLPQTILGQVVVEPGEVLSPPSVETVRSLGPGLGLIDGTAAGTYRPGDRVEVSARFVGLAGAVDQEIELGLEGPAGVIATLRTAPVGEAYPVGRWREGEVLRGRHLLRVPVNAPPGPYGVVLTGANGERVALGTIEVEPAPPHREAAPPEQRIDVPFGDAAVLLGADLPPEAAPGSELPVRLVWRAARDGTESYAVSLQLLAEGGRLVAQRDGPPADGTAPTNQWREDETIEDLRTLALPTDLAPGDYRVVVILYDQATGQRLPTPSGDLAEVGTVRVR